MIGSLAAIVAVAAFAPFFSPICEASVDVIVPSVTVNVSAPSDSWSSVAAIVIVCVAPAALLAANVTVPEVVAQVRSRRPVRPQRRAPRHLHLRRHRPPTASP